MYRNCCMQRRNCCSCNNSCTNMNEDMLENNCSNVSNDIEMDSCSCGFDEESLFPESPMLAQSYVPWQTLDKTFTPCVGLKMGTIFPELVSPYIPGQSMREIEYLKNSNEIGMGCNGNG